MTAPFPRAGLLAGGACCSPGLLLLLGIPALGAFVGLFSWLVPLSILLLGGARIWQHRQGAPPMFRLPWREPEFEREGGH